MTMLARLGAVASPKGIGVCCSAAPTERSEDPGASGDEALSSSNLMFEGTCQFLHDCSKWSRDLPDDQIEWGCDGADTCDDDEHWIAGPSKAYCGRTYKICHGDTCTTAKVRDISSAKGWEASSGTLDALGLKHGLTGKCSGYGGGKVSITRIEE
jgi:hypothetical protein